MRFTATCVTTDRNVDTSAVFDTRGGVRKDKRELDVIIASVNMIANIHHVIQQVHFTIVIFLRVCFIIASELFGKYSPDGNLIQWIIV